MILSLSPYTYGPAISNATFLYMYLSTQNSTRAPCNMQGARNMKLKRVWHGFISAGWHSKEGTSCLRTARTAKMFKPFHLFENIKLTSGKKVQAETPIQTHSKLYGEVNDKLRYNDITAGKTSWPPQVVFWSWMKITVLLFSTSPSLRCCFLPSRSKAYKKKQRKTNSDPVTKGGRGRNRPFCGSAAKQPIAGSAALPVWTASLLLIYFWQVFLCNL